MKAIDLPPFWTTGAIALILLCARVFPALTISGAPRLSAYALIIAGAALAIWAVVTFRRHQTTIHPGHTPSKLLTTGPFKFSRNPIYTGMMLVTLGIALYLGNILGGVVALGLFFVLDRKFARPEEALLIETFGQEAETYVEAVRRW